MSRKRIVAAPDLTKCCRGCGSRITENGWNMRISKDGCMYEAPSRPGRLLPRPLHRLFSIVVRNAQTRSSTHVSSVRRHVAKLSTSGAAQGNACRTGRTKHFEPVRCCPVVRQSIWGVAQRMHGLQALDCHCHADKASGVGVVPVTAETCGSGLRHLWVWSEVGGGGGVKCGLCCAAAASLRHCCRYCCHRFCRFRCRPLLRQRTGR